MSLGITKVYEIEKRVKKVLILNEKVVDYLYKRLTTAEKNSYYLGEPNTKHLVFLTGYNNYEEITKDKIRELLKDEDNLEKEIIAELAYNPEYEGTPFEVEHASPYDHRWAGDYDEDAYDDWKVIKYSLADFFYEDQFEREPYFAKHPEEFDFEDKVEEDRPRLVDERYW